jgi:hypothetical protein
MLCGLALTASVVQAQVETGAFLNKRATTTQQLVDQVRNDRAVRERYIRHYRMTGDEIIRWFSTLHPARLKQPGTFIVYNIRKDGVIRARVFELEKGHAVFSDQFGNPVLKMSCGNPFTGSPYGSPNQPPVGMPAAPRTAEIDIEPEAPLTAVVAPPPPIVPELETAPPAPIIPVQSAGNVGGGGAAGLALLLPLLFLGGQGGHSFSASDSIPVVPEPATMLVLAGGTLMMAARRRKKN